MAFPVVEATAVTESGNNATTDHTLNLPASIAAGDLLLLIAASDDAAAISSLTGWTSLDSTNVGSAVNGDVWYKKATGSEGSTQTVTLDTSNEAFSAVVHRISGAADPATQAPEFSKISDATGTNLTIDPASLTPTGGAKDYLWFLAIAQDRGGTVDTWSTNYGTNTAESGSSTGSAWTRVMSSWRTNNATSEDPGTFTATVTQERVAYTIAVHPAGATAITGTGAATLPALTADGEGATGYFGTGAADLPSPTASASGVLIYSGTGAATLPGITASGTDLERDDTPVSQLGPGGPTARRNFGADRQAARDGTPVTQVGPAGTTGRRNFGADREQEQSDNAIDAVLPLLTAQGIGKNGFNGSISAMLPTIEAQGLYVELPSVWYDINPQSGIWTDI